LTAIPPTEILDMLIVGAGISGIGMAAHLGMSCPGKRYAIVERRAALGGTWDLFRYPGVRSDSDMFTLGYSFAPWRSDRAIASGETIRAYLQQVADERGITPHIRFGAHVIGADWDSAAACWSVRMASGGTLHARFLFLGSGYYDYDNPHEPAIAGLDDFAGQVLHPQFWPESFDATAKRVVVIGSGATAATLVPALAAQTQVTMLQRTPSWYLPLPLVDRAARMARRLLPDRWSHALIRWRNVRMQATLFRRARADPAAVGEWLTGFARRMIGPGFSPEHFAPPYGPWQQRLCLIPGGDFYQALRAGSAGIVTGQIAQVEPDAIVLTDGRRIPADVIVTATGLRVAPMGKIPVTVDGVAVDFATRFWYRDCMFSNVPNLAALFGYLNAGWTLRVDVVCGYLCRLLNQMDGWHARAAIPALPDDHGLVEVDVLGDLSSGYLQRAQALVPRSATTPPWRINMDYLADRREMALAPIDDGWLRIER
jgi:cation diffusion facilitator CzcD-associated flavoprotein CzcO